MVTRCIKFLFFSRGLNLCNLQAVHPTRQLPIPHTFIQERLKYVKFGSQTWTAAESACYLWIDMLVAILAHWWVTTSNNYYQKKPVSGPWFGQYQNQDPQSDVRPPARMGLQVVPNQSDHIWLRWWFIWRLRKSSCFTAKSLLKGCWKTILLMS